MADITNEQLKNLILGKFAELRDGIKNVRTELKGQIKTVESRLVRRANHFCTSTPFQKAM